VIHASLHAVVALAYLLRSSPRRVVRQLPASATPMLTWFTTGRGQHAFACCRRCELWHARKLDRCPRCGEVGSPPVARTLKPVRAARAYESEAWRGGLRAGVAAALKLEEE
jgi:hypothetical protein